MEKSITLITTLGTLFLLLVINTANAGSDGGYVFTCPRQFKTGASNNMNLRRFGNLEPGSLLVQVLYSDSYNGNETLAVEKRYEIPEGDAITDFDLYIDKFEDYVYNGRLAINGSYGSNTIEGGDKIYFSNAKEYIVIIQTDKPIYKLGQTVLFRIVKVDRYFKPSGEDEEADIWVDDSKGTRLFQWKKVPVGNGIKQLEFPLSDEPVLGLWKISVSIKNEITSTNFEVKEYVLPKFEVVIIIPPFVLANAEEIPITICAKYTYGKQVSGFLNLIVSLEKFAWSRDKFPQLEYKEKIEGCVNFTVNVSRIEPEDYYRYRRIQCVANVEEKGTGVTRNETKFIQRQFSPLSLNFNQEQKQYFKPGLPYNGKLRVSNPDDTPAGCEPIRICYTVSRERVLQQWWATRKVRFCKNYTSDDNGIIEYAITPQNTDSVSISIEAKSLRYLKEKKRDGRDNTLNQPQTSMSLSPWFSKSGNFIQLQPKQEDLKCGSKIRIPILFTSKSDGSYKFYYQVSKQTEILKTGSLEHDFSTEDDVSSDFQKEDKLINEEETQVMPPPQSSDKNSSYEEEDCPSARETRYVPPIGKATLEISVDASLSPSFHLLVYYIREDGETIADSAKFKVEKCFQNEVSFEFGDEVRQPGTKTSLSIKASPNSLCGIKVVDKSVSLLDSSDQLTKERVFSLLDSMDPGIYYENNRCNEDVPQPGLFKATSPGIIRPPRPWASSKYVDSMAAWDDCGFLVISDRTLFTRPCKSNRNNVVYESQMDSGNAFGGPGGAGHKLKKVAMASTARRPAAPQAADAKMGNEVTKSAVEIRNYFPETWLFKMELTNSDGEFVTKAKLPHTITQWVGSAVCINQEDGLGISDSTSIEGFQAFFISFTLPYSVIRGETFEMVVSIFNYVSDSLPITVSLDSSDNFEVVGEFENIKVCIAPGTSENIPIQMKATKLGTSNITVYAQTSEDSEECGSSSVSDSVAKDAMTYSVIVEAEGFPVEEVNSALFCVDEGETMEKSIELGLPDDLVEDSQRAYIDFTGNLLGPSLDNIENLVQLPTGCGEQNMVKFVPNVLVYDLLLKTKTLTPKLEQRLIKNMNTGYQRQLTYRHEDGSYSAFGDRDKEGSMFLTAFVLRYFKRAEKFISIDNNTIAQMQGWIVSKQDSNGCFPDFGKIIDLGLQGGVEKETSKGAITAYVLASLEISEYENKTVKDAALSCISKDDNEDLKPYAIFLYAYVEALLGKEESAKKRIDEIKPRANTTGGVEYYPNGNASKSRDIETAAYAILAIFEAGGSAEDVLPIIQYLTHNMNRFGGFSSTQDTCMGLQALTEFAKRTLKDPIDVTMKITGGLEKEIIVTEDNKLVVKRNKISQVPSQLQLEGSGTGCALYQTVLRYNTNTPPGNKAFDFKVTGECVDDECKQVRIIVEVSYLPLRKKTGMALIEIKMLSGMTPVKESIEKLKEDKNLNVMRTDFEENKLVLYFDGLSNERKTFSCLLEELVRIPDRLPATAKVYDYYNTETRAETLYSVGGCKDGNCSEEN